MKINLKKAVASIMAIASLSTCAVVLNVSAGTIAWNSNYGVVNGSSSTSVWSATGTPPIRKVKAETTIANAVPYIYAKVDGYVNNSVVLTGSRESHNSTSAYIEKSSQNYVNSNVTGDATHAIWSASLTRCNYFTHF